MGFIDIWAIDFEYGRVFCGAANKDIMEAYMLHFQESRWRFTTILLLQKLSKNL